MEPSRPIPLRLVVTTQAATGCLPANAVLGSHLVDEFIGHDGIVATYRGHHLVSGAGVVIREYFPSDVSARGFDYRVAPLAREDDSAYEAGLATLLVAAQRMQAIDSRHVAAVVEILQEHGTAYLLSEQVEGEPLPAWVARRARLSDAQIVGLAIDILNALEAIHEAGLRHGDVGEDHVIIDSEGSAVLMHADTMLHGSDAHRDANADASDLAVTEDLSALAAVLIRLCHAGAAAGSSAADLAARERSQMLMMLIERGLPGSRELDSLDASRWRKSFERLRSQVVTDPGAASVGAFRGLAPPSRDRVRPESVVVAQVQAGAPVFPAVLEGDTDGAGAKASRNAWDRLAGVLEVGLVPALLLGAWFLIPSHRPVVPEPTAPRLELAVPLAPAAVLAPAVGDISMAPPAGAPPSTGSLQEAVPDGPTPGVPQPSDDQQFFPQTLQTVTGWGPLALDQPGLTPHDQTDPGTPQVEQNTVLADGHYSTIDSLLASAQADLDARRMTVPAGNNAMEKYQAVLKLDRRNVQARQGLRRIGDAMAMRAQKSLDAGDLAEAEAMLGRARVADPRSSKAARIEQLLQARRAESQVQRVAEPYPPRFEADASPPIPAPAPTAEDEALTRADELRKRFGGR